MRAGSTPANIALPQVPRLDNAKLTTFLDQIETAISNLYTGTIYPLLNNPFTYAVRAVPQTSSPYTIVNADTVLAAAASSGADTDIVLPTASGSGRGIFAIKTDSNAHNVVVQRSGADTIAGATSYTLSTQYQTVQLIDVATGLWGVF